MTVRGIAEQLATDGRETAEQTIHRWLTAAVRDSMHSVDARSDRSGRQPRAGALNECDAYCAGRVVIVAASRSSVCLVMATIAPGSPTGLPMRIGGFQAPVPDTNATEKKPAASTNAATRNVVGLLGHRESAARFQHRTAHRERRVPRVVVHDTRDLRRAGVVDVAGGKDRRCLPGDG